jgi:mRNA interferase RelE/StbE
MKVLFGSVFQKDLMKIKDSNLKSKIKKAIITLEESENLLQISNVKKMRGHSSAYRIRIGDYRLGFYFEDDVVNIARVVKRNDIYKLFP